MSLALLIKGGRVIDPVHDVDGKLDLFIENGMFQQLGEHLPADGAQTTPQTPPASVPATDDSFLRQLAEAEQRGYLRGRNESIEQLMREPAPLERPSAPLRPAAESGESAPMILNNPRVSIWDR